MLSESQSCFCESRGAFSWAWEPVFAGNSCLPFSQNHEQGAGSCLVSDRGFS